VLATASGLAFAAAPAASAATPGSLTLTPSTFSGIAGKNVEVGPLGLYNGTRRDYRVEAFPVLVEQDRTGAITVRTDRPSLARAARLIRAKRSRFVLRSGGSHRTRAVLSGQAARNGLAGGIAFKATPVEATKGIVNTLQLTGTMFLRPRGAVHRLRAEAVRAEQAAARRVQLLTPVTNEGRSFARVQGRIVVRDASGARVTSAAVKRITVLPGATVDLAARLAEALPVGRYTLQARLRVGARRLSSSGDMQLFAPGQVRSEQAEITGMGDIKAFAGEPLEVSVPVENTGNVAYAPTAEYELRDPSGDGTGRVISKGPLASAVIGPGTSGKVTGSVAIPAGLAQGELSVRLVSGDREVDSLAETFSVASKPSVQERIGDNIRANAMTYMLIMLLAVVGLGAALVRVAIRR
jgi:hypothetical protein